MKKVGKQFRQFKTTLTDKIYKCVKDLKDPRSLYPKLVEYDITEKDWDTFVQSRLTPEFQVIQHLQ